MKTSAPLPPFTRRARRFSAVLAVNFFALAGSLLADQHTAGVPQLSSNPGADFTIYVDVAGFNYTGTWFPESGTTYTPGSTPAVNDIPSNGTFSAADVTQIQNIYTRVAQSYVGFNVNVTTIDPAVAAGMGGTDAARQAYYDATPNMMHTVVGSQIRAGGSKWFSTAADGVSPGIGIVAGRVAAGSGDHTNWMFSEAQAGAGNLGNPNTINGDYIGAISAHENGHSFGLYHQGDFVGPSNTPVNEYSNGDNFTGNGSYVPIIGNADGRQRINWRIGDTHPGDVQTRQNDVGLQLSTNTAAVALAAGRTGGADLHLVNDGKGHDRATATGLAINSDGTVNFTLASGHIVPLSEVNPQAIGAENYTKDVYIFSLAADSTIFLTAHDSTQLLVAGVADGNGTLRSTLSIFGTNGALLGSGIEDASTLFETYNGTLLAGTYYVEIGSFGGHAQDSPQFNPATYFDMGAYFLTGSGFTVVPEPGTWVLVLLGAGGLLGVVRLRGQPIRGESPTRAQAGPLPWPDHGRISPGDDPMR